MIDPGPVFSGNVQLTRVTALPGGEHDSFGPVSCLCRSDMKYPVLFFDPVDALHRADIEPRFFDNVMPVADKVLPGGAIEPEFAQRRLAIRFSVDPFALGEVFDGIGDLAFLQHDKTHAAFLRLQSSIESGGSGTNDDDVVRVLAAADRFVEPGDVFDDLITLRHGIFDHGCARQITDDKKSGDIAFVVFFEERAFVLAAAGMQNIDYFFPYRFCEVCNWHLVLPEIDLITPDRPGGLPIESLAVICSRIPGSDQQSGDWCCRTCCIRRVAWWWVLLPTLLGFCPDRHSSAS